MANNNEKIKTVSIGFDISTSVTGYAMLINGKPIVINTKHGDALSIGKVETTPMEQYESKFNVKNKDGTVVMKQDGTPLKQTKTREKHYTQYGDRAFNSTMKIIELTGALYPFIEFLNMEFQEKNSNPPTINIVYEIAEIPASTKRYFNKQLGKMVTVQADTTQNIVTTKKLAIYTGKVEQAVSALILAAGYHIRRKVSVKFVTPREWQNKIMPPATSRKDKVMPDNRIIKGTKTLSIEAANRDFKKFGIELTDSDDIADAYNIAKLAPQLRDSMAVRTTNKAKLANANQELKKAEVQLAQTKVLYTDMMDLATNKHAKAVLSAKAAKKTSKDVQAMLHEDKTNYLNKAEREKLHRYASKGKALQKKIKEIKNGK